MELSKNPLLSSETNVKTVDLQEIEAPTVQVRPRRSGKREFLDLRRKQTAAEAIAPLTKDVELYGFTKGQFSLLDLLAACLEKTGPADLILSTWTAAPKEIDALAGLQKAGKLTSIRLLLDFTFVRRDPAAAHSICQAFGLDAIRIASTHAKFAVFSNAEWSLVLQTSMNLNMNPRFEDFRLAHDPATAIFLITIIQEIWAKQRKTLGNDGRRADHFKFWNDNL